MFRKVAFTMYPAVDMKRAEHFYRETLGLGPCSGSVEQGWIEFDLPEGGCLALTVHSGGQPDMAAGGAVALEVEDLDGLVEALEARDVRILASRIESPVCRMAICADSEGNRLVLHQLKAGRGSDRDQA